jgi:hypothetical protein
MIESPQEVKSKHVLSDSVPFGEVEGPVLSAVEGEKTYDDSLY